MRVFNTQQLANRSLVGDAVNDYGQVASVIDDFDDRNRRRKLQKRDDEEYERGKERRSLLQGRDDQQYRQGQEDRSRNLQRQEVLQGREDQLFSEGVQDRSQQREMRQESHNAQMYRADEYRNQEGYRRELEKLQITGQKLGLDAQKMQMQEARFDQERKKEAIKTEDIAKDAQRLDALMANGSGDTDEINKVARRIAENSGLEFDQIDENFQAIEELQDALQQGIELDDPAIQPALKALWASKGFIDGRKGNYDFDVMQRTEDGFVAMLRSKDGKAGVETYGKSSEKDDIMVKFDAVDIMEKAIGVSQIAGQLKTVKDAYGLTPPPKDRKTTKLGKDDRLVDEQTGEVIAGGSSGEPVSKQSEIMSKFYEDEGDLQGQMAHTVLAEKGIVSQQAVEQAKELAGEGGDINKAAAMVASRSKRQEKLAGGPEPVRSALKETLSNHEGLTAEAVDLVKDKEIMEIMKRFAGSDQISVDQMLSEVAEAARQMAQKKVKRGERSLRLDRYKAQPDRTIAGPGQ